MACDASAAMIKTDGKYFMVDPLFYPNREWPRNRDEVVRAVKKGSLEVEAVMRSAVMGAGSVGARRGRLGIEGGEVVIGGLRNPADPKHAALPKDRVKAPAEAVKAAEVVVAPKAALTAGVKWATMTSTPSRTNSVAISAARSLRPSE